ncbi:MAG: butyrate kinase [Patescibacteria group bacterium]|jgi:butyrate kinase
MTEVLIVINPGSTSTKFAVWSREYCVSEQVVRHEASQLAPRAVDQFDYRRELIDQALEPLLKDSEVIGVVGRGGLLKPLAGGTYLVNQAMLGDLNLPTTGNHASNLGAILAYHYAQRFRVDAFVVDPVTVDEFLPFSRPSGVVWFERKSRSHALNIKYSVNRAAHEIDKPLSRTRFVVAHLGGGTSIAAVQFGRIIDVNDALAGMGPYSPERAGALPIGPLVKYVLESGATYEQLIHELTKRSGLMAYCGTSDVREVMVQIRNGNAQAALAFGAMIYQDAKEIGAMAVALQGQLDAVIITGGLAHSHDVIQTLRPYIEHLGPIIVYPGEGELEALAAGAFRVLDGVEPPIIYV